MIFRLGKELWTSSDATSGYEVEIRQGGSVKEFVDIVLTKNEWGYIGIEAENSIFGSPAIEYQRDKIVVDSEEFRQLYDRQVAKIHASGGWSRMDYKLELAEDLDKTVKLTEFPIKEISEEARAEAEKIVYDNSVSVISNSRELIEQEFKNSNMKMKYTCLFKNLDELNVGDFDDEVLEPYGKISVVQVNKNGEDEIVYYERESDGKGTIAAISDLMEELREKQVELILNDLSDRVADKVVEKLEKGERNE